MSFAAVQKHVAVLESAGLVIKRRHGREQLVRSNVETIRKANRLLDQFEAVWRDRIDRIGRDARRRSTEPISERNEVMTVTNVQKDPEGPHDDDHRRARCDRRRAWQLWADPRQLERWWGPPTYPATVVDHDSSPVAASPTS